MKDHVYIIEIPHRFPANCYCISKQSFINIALEKFHEKDINNFDDALAAFGDDLSSIRYFETDEELIEFKNTYRGHQETNVYNAITSHLGV